MAVLNAAKRKSLPKSEFAGPGRSFPIPDANHARLALAMASKEFNAGKLSKSAEEHIVAKANAFLASHK